MVYEYDSIERYLRKFKDFDFRYCGEYRYLIVDDLVTIKIIKTDQIRFFYKDILIAIKNIYMLNREQKREQIYRVVKLARKLIKRAKYIHKTKYSIIK